MTPHRFFAAAVAALCLAGAGGVLAQPPQTPTPPADGLPDGPGKEVLLRACSSCHDTSTVIGTPRTPQGWETVIGSMINNGAEMTSEEQAALQAYLVKNFGPPPAAQPDEPKPPPGG